MKQYFASTMGLCLAFASCAPSAQEKKEELVPQLAAQFQYLVDNSEPLVKDSTLVSPRTLEDGKLQMVRRGDWTSGFYPGTLWQLFELTGDSHWKELAEKATARIEGEKYNGRTHDMGFKVYDSYGKGYKLTQDAHYKEVIIQSAKTLSTRFNPIVGCIRSWDHHADVWKFPVIIDNMLNLELLFAATKLTGDSTYYNMAVSHAETTMKNHFRPDGGSYHVVDYDPETGKVLHRQTHQGYADESTWSRGQAWALYGYTMCYRETGKQEFLDKAMSLAAWIQERLPEDGVPYWDFDAPGIPNEPRDASAAAVMASGLYELDQLTDKGGKWRNLADHILQSLTDHYRNTDGADQGFLLAHSTGSKAHNSEVDVPLIYADYYYLEAILRKNGNF